MKLYKSNAQAEITTSFTLIYYNTVPEEFVDFLIEIYYSKYRKRKAIRINLNYVQFGHPHQYVNKGSYNFYKQYL